MTMRRIALLWALLFLPVGPLFAAVEPAIAPDSLTVLSYHEITDAANALVPAYAVTPTNFVRQMDWLRNHGYHFVSLSDVISATDSRRPLPDKSVLITFDDGYQSVYDNAWPILRQFHIPAVIAVVGSWLEEKGQVDFDGKPIPRNKLLSWDELRQMHESGLIEIGSHSFDLHHGVQANPQGNMEPATTARLYFPDSKTYEDEAAYRKRIYNDLKHNNDLIHKYTGATPRVLAWPYGRYNTPVREIAERLGLRVGLTLDDGANRADTPLWGLRRILVEGPMALWDVEREINLRNRDVPVNSWPRKVLHVDLDYIYDPDPAQQERNLGRLLDNIAAMGVNTVYLQAFADPDGDGAANAVYFPSRHLPMRADLFNRVAWQIRTRTPVKRLYAWMPMLAFQLPANEPAANDKLVTLPSEKADHINMGYPRLSPFSPRARQTIREIYEDLARSASFEGLLFHDDVTLSDYEDNSEFAQQTYRDWGLPGSVAELRKSDDLLGRWTILKINYLDDFAQELADIVRAQQPQMRTARNLYARVALNPRAEVWYSQALDNSLAHYDYTAIEAMPYMEQAPDAAAFYHSLVDAVKDRDAMNKVVFELQTVDWRNNNTPIPTAEIAATIRNLYSMGALHIALYPEMLFDNHPDPALLKPVLDSKPNVPDVH